jgi:ATP-dependent DNA helicase RecG
VEAESDLSDPVAQPWPAMLEQIRQGRQGYVVCPLVEQSESQSAAAATEAHAALAAGALRGLRVGLVHGKQKADERDSIMAEFSAGHLDVLVATTVIEVGVNVPNATAIAILDAGRFGIAQLHQLRGRVGRGVHPSLCVLVGRVRTADGQRRLQALCDTTDGFALSEIDLDVRGEGSVFGARQAGASDLRVASLRADRELVAQARADAARLLDGDPTLARRPGLYAEVRSALGADADAWLTRS